MSPRALNSRARLKPRLTTARNSSSRPPARGTRTSSVTWLVVCEKLTQADGIHSDDRVGLRPYGHRGWRDRIILQHGAHGVDRAWPLQAFDVYHVLFFLSRPRRRAAASAPSASKSPSGPCVVQPGRSASRWSPVSQRSGIPPVRIGQQATLVAFHGPGDRCAKGHAVDADSIQALVDTQQDR